MGGRPSFCLQGLTSPFIAFHEEARTRKCVTLFNAPGHLFGRPSSITLGNPPVIVQGTGKNPKIGTPYFSAILLVNQIMNSLKEKWRMSRNEHLRVRCTNTKLCRDDAFSAFAYSLKIGR